MHQQVEDVESMFCASPWVGTNKISITIRKGASLLGFVKFSLYSDIVALKIGTYLCTLKNHCLRIFRRIFRQHHPSALFSNHSKEAI